MPDQPQVDSNRKHRPVWQLRDLDLRRILLGSFLLMIFLCVFRYVRLGTTIDQWLADGPFAASTDILTAPQALSVGEPMEVKEVVRSLRQSGYTGSRDNPEGWFEDHPGAIEIFPGTDSSGAEGR